MKSIVIFTPTYNEIDNIEIFIRQIFEVLPECKLIIVDDNSPDGTSEVVNKLRKEFKNLYLIIRKGKRGRGYAGIEGFKKALELNADIIIEMDADLSHSPYEIHKLLDALNKTDADIIVGSRYVKGGEDSERNVLRRIISFLARIYIKIFTGLPFKDVTSGFKVYRSNVVSTILPHLKSADQFIVTEVNYLCKTFNFRFHEVPIIFHKRARGKSKLTIFNLLLYLIKTLKLVIENFLKDKYNLLFLKSILILNILRLFLINSFGLTDDEAHYWQYAQYLDFSYYDHPPLVGYLIYLSTKAFGNNILGVRAVALVFFNLASFYLYRLIKEIYNSKVSFYTNLLFNFVPIFFVGSLITVPDTILGGLWIMYMFYFYKFVQQKDNWNFYFCGIILGLSFLAKYTAVFLAISSLIVILSQKELRTWLFKKESIIFYLIVLFIFSPVILWNLTHNWASFRYQISHGMGNKTFISLPIFIENFFYQSFYLSPFLFLYLWFQVFLFFLRGSSYKYSEKFLFYFAMPGIIFFNIIAFKNKILPHWPAVCYISLLPFIYEKSKNYILYAVSFIFSLLITTIIIFGTIFAMIPIPEYLKNADTPDKLYGWDIAAKETLKLLKEFQLNLIITHKYYSAGQLRFALSRYFPKSIPEVFCLDKEFNQYDFWYRDLSKYNNQNAIFFIDNRFPDDEFLKVAPFKKIKLYSVVTFRRSKNWPQRKFKFYICENFDYEKAKREFIIYKYNNFLKTTEFLRNYDKNIFLKINKSRLYDKKWFRSCCYFVTNLGNGLVLIPIMSIVLLLLDKKNFIYNFFSFLIIAFLGGMVIHLLKFLFDKPRPLKLFTDILNQPINVIGEQLKEFGFPSGHTFLAFCSAIFISQRFKKRKFLIIIFFILAIIIGISRVLVGAHFLSDVIAGMFIGIVFSLLLLKLEREIISKGGNYER